MAVTYDDTLADTTSQVRFEIGDTVEDSGPRPDPSSNFSDNEIAAIVTSEGGWGKAAAHLCEILAAEWSREAGSLRVGEFQQALTDRAAMFMKKAQELRRKYGGQAAPTQVVPTRVDGFSDDIDADDI